MQRCPHTHTAPPPPFPPKNIMRAAQHGRSIFYAKAALLGAALCKPEDCAAPHKFHPSVLPFRSEPSSLTEVAGKLEYLYRTLAYDRSVVHAHFVLISDFLARTGGVLTDTLLLKLVPTALQVSAKYHSDHFFKNICVAKVCNISIAELNSLEVLFLRVIEFNANASSRAVARVADALDAEGLQLCAQKASASRLRRNQQQQANAKKSSNEAIIPCLPLKARNKLSLLS